MQEAACRRRRRGNTGQGALAACPGRKAPGGRALVLQFALRIEKEENVLLPMLRRGGVDAEGLLAGKAEITGTGEGR